MKNQQTADIMYKKVAWTIKNFSKLKTEYLYSDVFTFGDTAWRVLIYPEGNDVEDDLSIFLEVADAENLPEGWSIYAEYSLAVVNHDSRKSPMKYDCEAQFCAEDDNLGRSFMPLSVLCDPNSGFILNDTCIIEVEWFVLKSEGISRGLFEEYEFIDFRGLGQIEKAFVPLLEEVCLWYPSLVECQKKRTGRFTEWAFTALGRVLHFLKTKKGQDMIVSEDACEHLQHLWEELETFRFDLNWVEPHVQSALGMKAYVEKAEQVNRMKKNLVSLETKKKKLREYLVDTEENVEKVRKDLAKAQEDFEERDMDAVLGYGKVKN